MLFRKIFYLEIFVIILSINIISFAQSTTTPDSTSQKSTMEKDSSDTPSFNFNKMPEWHEMITNIPGDWSKYFQVTFQENKIPLYLTVATTTAALVVTDDKTWQESDKFYKGGGANKLFSDIFTEMGDGKTQFGLGALFGIYGLITNDARAVRTGSQIVQAVLASGTVVQVLKHITGRESPFVATSPTGIWNFFPNRIDYHQHVPHFDAFPSGHVTTFLATVIVIAENYPEVWWIRPAGYLFTAGLAAGMVNKGIHWYSDYPLAIVLGYTFGMIAAHPEGIPNSIAGKKLNVMPILVEKGFGLSVGYSF